MIEAICPGCGKKFTTYKRSSYRRKTCGSDACAIQTGRATQARSAQTRRINSEGWRR